VVLGCKGLDLACVGGVRVELTGLALAGALEPVLTGCTVPEPVLGGCTVPEPVLCGCTVLEPVLGGCTVLELALACCIELETESRDSKLLAARMLSPGHVSLINLSHKGIKHILKINL